MPSSKHLLCRVTNYLWWTELGSCLKQIQWVSFPLQLFVAMWVHNTSVILSSYPCNTVGRCPKQQWTMVQCPETLLCQWHGCLKQGRVFCVVLFTCGTTYNCTHHRTTETCAVDGCRSRFGCRVRGLNSDECWVQPIVGSFQGGEKWQLGTTKLLVFGTCGILMGQLPQVNQGNKG